MSDLLATLDDRWDAFAASPHGRRTLVRWKVAEQARRRAEAAIARHLTRRVA